MTESRRSRATTRRTFVVREILDAAWELMAQEGVAEVSVRQVARSVGMRQQSLTYYFPTKHGLLDALFADGFSDLARVLEDLPDSDDSVEAVVDLAVAVVEFCVAHPARYHLLFQRTIPGFQPTEESHRVAREVLRELIVRLGAAGVTDPADVALVRALISGLASEQTANDPGGSLFVDQTRRGVRALMTAAPSSPTRTGSGDSV
jgi:AcrR family transcriptional regulator